MSASSVLSVIDWDRASPVIDEEHLGRMTLGDRGLEREILEIFLRQIDLILARIAGARPPMVAAAAHTLLGSARGIGTGRVAWAAERLEYLAAAGRSQADIDAAIDELKAAAGEASAAIGARLAAASLDVSRDQ
jgi:HPt (histidine-containing phosphotransfer) domain-containing protein